MKKRLYVRAGISFRDVYNTFYCERFICRSFLSLRQILDLSNDMLENFPDNKIVWSSFKITMSYVFLPEYKSI